MSTSHNSKGGEEKKNNNDDSSGYFPFSSSPHCSGKGRKPGMKINPARAERHQISIDLFKLYLSGDCCHGTFPFKAFSTHNFMM
jgi:hypothetical protein